MCINVEFAFRQKVDDQLNNFSKICTHTKRIQLFKNYFQSRVHISTLF
jgi:hypothetical protein